MKEYRKEKKKKYKINWNIKSLRRNHLLTQWRKKTTKSKEKKNIINVKNSLKKGTMEARRRTENLTEKQV